MTTKIGSWEFGIGNIHPSCVVCAERLEPDDIKESEVNDIPGACKKHLVMVLEEVEKDFSMWPDWWFGHWIRVNDDESDESDAELNPDQEYDGYY